ncbi:hypothetical protein J7T55_009084 [Diaporthe amygdali]|uniref:uncharacterized protein n=1 Tax=Phomopsis amygdali TaxID=1214568 RepID=UPI0022FF22F5|nr:uncharacterized protein J7T55_009084 [Diaporthe amygdali]KAJ0118301.1 hypothetical protein J7T55_009084 [Diaporthe amygdali]
MTQIDESTSLSIQVKLHKDDLKYPAKTHAHKVKRELAASDSSSTRGLIYLPGQNSAQYEDTDGERPFRQRRYAFYLSGADFPGCAVTYDIARDVLTLWIPIRKPEQIIWFGALPSIEECTARFDVDSVKDITGLQPYLKETLTADTTLYVLHESQTPPRPYGPASGFTVDYSALQPAMDLARAVKSDYEIAQIREANYISSEAHRHVQQHIKSLTSEAQVENLFIAKCRELGAKKQAYPVIAGSGPNAATLHYGANNQDFDNRQLMVLDAGAEYGCYASDVTRTFPLNGKFTSEAKEVYAIVEKMQDTCISLIKPGASWATITNKAQLVALDGLKGLGIITGNEPALTLRAVRAFFMHGLGHLVGLDTHDVIGGVHIHSMLRGKAWSLDKMDSLAGAHPRGRYSAEGHRAGHYQGGGDRFSPPLEKDMVITCEPGLYFNRAYIEWFLAGNPDVAPYVDKNALEKYYPVCGCRIEDCILVTDDGYENLTTAPKGEEMLRVVNGK